MVDFWGSLSVAFVFSAGEKAAVKFGRAGKKGRKPSFMVWQNCFLKAGFTSLGFGQVAGRASQNLALRISRPFPKP